MEDLFNMMEKKMEELHHSHDQILSLMGTFTKNLNQKESTYKAKLEELKTLFDIYKQSNTITFKKNKDDIVEISEQFSNTSLYEVGLVEKLLLEKSKDYYVPSVLAGSNQSLMSSSLVSQISEHFSKNPTLTESPRKPEDSLYLPEKQTFVKNTSSPMFDTCNSKNFNKENSAKNVTISPFAKSNCRISSKVKAVEPIYENFVTPVKFSSKIDHMEFFKGLANKQLARSSNTVITIEDGITSENPSDSSNIETDESFGSAPSSVYSSRHFFDRPNSYSFISPLSSVRCSRTAINALHYCEPNIVISCEKNCLSLRKKPKPKFSGDLEESVVETLIKHWKPKQVFFLRAWFEGYFCRRLYNSPRVYEIRKIIQECERIRRTIGDVPSSQEDKLLTKSIVADIKLHKDIVHNIFFETTLNSKLIMINEVLEKVEKRHDHPRIVKKPQKKFVTLNNKQPIKPAVAESYSSLNDSVFLPNDSRNDTSSSKCKYKQDLQQKRTYPISHSSKVSR